MFGAMGALRTMRQMQQAKELPRREVSKMEMIRLMRQSGMSAKDAKFHAGINAGMGKGVYTQVGGELIAIKPTKRKA